MKKFKCVCGYIHDGDDAPDQCPKCGAPKDKFTLLDDKAAELVERSRHTNALHCRAVNLARKLEGAATNLTADLEMAKVRAIRENAFVVVEFNDDSYTIFVDNGEGGGTAADWSRNGSEILAQGRDLPAGVQIDTASLSFPLVNTKTRFNGRGIPPDILGPEIVSIANTADSRQITINRLGFINVQ